MIRSDHAETIDVAERLRRLQERIAAAARRRDRDPADVTLVAVSKTFPAERITEAFAAGQRDFGESRPQELRDKSGQTPSGVRWHFVGRLQRNKIKYVVGRCDLIHSVDDVELAVDIGARAQRAGLRQPVLVQVNAGGDPAKAGFTLTDAGDAVTRIRAVDGLALQGLMTIPPMGADPRPVFATLRALRDRLRERFPEVADLSMGMSNDFEVAVEEGATIVRLGEAIFGPRPRPA